MLDDFIEFQNKFYELNGCRGVLVLSDDVLEKCLKDKSFIDRNMTSTEELTFEQFSEVMTRWNLKFILEKDV